jgi:hypothetical protein
VDAAAACVPLVMMTGEDSVGTAGSGRETPVHVSSGGAGPDEALPQEEVEGHRHEAALQQADPEPQDKAVEALGGSVAGGVTGAGSVEAAAMGAVVDTQVPEGTASASTSECKVRKKNTKHTYTPIAAVCPLEERESPVAVSWPDACVCILCVVCMGQSVETSKDGLKAMGAHVSVVYKNTIRKWRCDTT